MPTIDPWMIGTDLTALTVQPMKADVNGTLTTNGSSYSFLGILEGARGEGNRIVEQINAIGNLYDNEVVIKQDDTFIIREIMRRGDDQINLEKIFVNVGQREHAAITYTRAGNTKLFYAAIGTFRQGGGREKWVAEMQFRQADTSGDVPINPLYT